MESLSDYSHCFICLQEQDPKIARELVKKNPKRIESLQPLIHYISTKGTENVNFNGTPPDDLENDRPLPLPSVCISCYDALADLHRLHRCLVDIQLLIQSQTGRIQNILNLNCVTSTRATTSQSSSGTRLKRASVKDSANLNSTRQKYLAHLKKIKAPADVISGMKRLLQNESHEEFEFKSGSETAQTQLPVATPKSKNRTRSNVKAKAEMEVDPNFDLDTGDGDTIVKLENSEMEVIDENESESEELFRVTVLEAKGITPDVDEPDLGDPLRESESDSSNSEYVPSDTDEVDHDLDLDTEEETERKSESRSRSSKKRKTEIEDDDDDLNDNDDVKEDGDDGDMQNCDICSKQFPKSEMSTHIETHLGKPGWDCISCGRVFATRSVLLKHLRHIKFPCKDDARWSSDPRIPHLCRSCTPDTVFGTEEALYNHVFETHEKVDQRKNQSSSIYRHRCRRCLQGFVTLEGLQFHFNIHLNHNKRQRCNLRRLTPRQSPDDFQKCGVCKIMVTRGTVGFHMKLIHSPEVSNGTRSDLIECKICSEDKTHPEETCFFLNQKFYLTHLKTAHPRREPKPCHICGSKFTNHLKLRNHYLQVHKEGIQYKCELCPKSFHVRSSLSTHMHHSHRHPDSVPCDLCVRDNGDIPKSYYRSQEVLDYHMKVYHRKDRYKCERCPAHFRCKFDLSEHEKESHSREPFICHQCSREFFSQLDFTKHQSIHRDEVVRKAREAKEKPEFSCKLCPRKFTVSASFKYHLKTAHETEKKFTCEKCGKSFKAQASLRIHLKGHPPEGEERPRPFVCDLCGKGFSYQSVLDSHRRRHTGERPFECRLCESKFRQRSTLRSHMKQHEKAVFKRKRTHDMKVD